MKKLILMFGFGTTLISYAQIPTNNLVGHYKFDGNLTDFSINNNDIVTGTGNYVQDRHGNANGALYMNGSSDSLLFPIDEFSPITGDFAISFWYKTNSPKIMNLFSSKQFASDTITNFEIQLSSNNSTALEFSTQSFFTTYVYWNGTGINGNAIAEGTPGAFNKGEWCHFAITREADTLKIYRNHLLSYLSLDNFYGGSLGDAIDLVFSANPYLFKGAIDDMRLYNRNLNQAEIDLLWFENRPFTFYQLKSTDAYVQGSNLLVSWEYDLSQISDSILVETSVNGGPFSPITTHTNNSWESFTYLDLNLPAETRIEVRVSDFTNPLLTNSTGEITVSPYDWVEVTDSLPFAAKDGSGLVVFQGKMWLLGGWDPPYHAPVNTHSEVWSSTDGANWQFVTTAPWPARHAAAWLVGNGAMWVIGADQACLTDVWKSEDGINWTQTCAAIPGFTARLNQNYAFINGKLTIYGGEQCGSGTDLNEVWTSLDGITWTQEQNAPWEGRGMQINNCVDGSGQMWMLGGSNEGSRRSYNEVWKSADGINWTLVNESAPWSGRYWHTVSYFDNKMWLMGGMATGTEMNDVWYSADGITWKELKTTTGNWPAGTRHAQSTTVFDNALWYMCAINTNNSWKIINTTSTIGLKEKKEIKSNINVFPNPVKDKLTLSLNNTENNTIQIVNVAGIMMKEINSKSNNKVDIDVSDLPSGLYFVHVKNQINQSVKFVKQ